MAFWLSHLVLLGRRGHQSLPRQESMGLMGLMLCHCYGKRGQAGPWPQADTGHRMCQS